MIKKVLALFIFFDLCLIAQTARAVDWYDCCSWGYRKMITIDYTKVSTSDLSYFPVLVSTTDVAWKDTSNGGHVGQSDGGDILFTSSDGTTKLDHEIELYTNTTGELVAWVEVPTVSASANTVIYIYYGNATCADQWNINGTWNEGGTASIEGVWHLKESCSSSGCRLDSTSNANNVTPYSSTTITDLHTSSGKFEGADSFDGSNDYDVAANESSFDFERTASFTMMYWAKPVTSDTSVQIAVSKMNDYTPYRGIQAVHNFAWRSGGGCGSGSVNYAGYITFCLSNTAWSNVNTIETSSATNLNDGNWHQYVFTTTGSGTAGMEIYEDSNKLTKTQRCTSLSATILTDYAFAIGGKSDGNPQWHEVYNGVLDEVRVYNRALGAAEITTIYNNQSSPSTFYSVSSEETMGDFFLLFD